EFNPELLPGVMKKAFRVKTLSGDKRGTEKSLRGGRLRVTVAPMGLTAVSIEGLQVSPRFQHKLLDTDAGQAWNTDYTELEWGGARAMVLNFGPAMQSAYVYLQADDAEFREVAL